MRDVVRRRAKPSPQPSPRGRGGQSGAPHEHQDAQSHEGGAVGHPDVARDLTLEDPRCVLQIIRRHYARYTPEMVERACGVPRDLFLQVAQTILDASGRDRTTAFCYAVAWTQHTVGSQIIGACAMLQLLLGNVGRDAGILTCKGKFETADLITGEAGFSPLIGDGPSKHGTFRAVRAGG